MDKNSLINLYKYIQFINSSNLDAKTDLVKNQQINEESLYKSLDKILRTQKLNNRFNSDYVMQI